jgi:hypothetical protein
VTGAADFLRGAKAIALGAVLALPAAGCAILGEKQDTPGWYKERLAEVKKQPYPTLLGVPNATASSRTQTSWAQVQGAVESSGAALDANPRAAPPTESATVAAGEFEAAARRETEGPRPER